MTLIESLEHRASVLRAREVAALFQVTPQHIYKMAAKGTIPSFKVAGAIRFDPRLLAIWLRHRMPVFEPEGSNLLKRTA
jgi:predicted DNA-binding transcriptional regulator AlpA